MTIFQKAIKVRKECEKHKKCNFNNNCPYNDYCMISSTLLYSPMKENLKTLSKAIQLEKWKVK